MLASSGPFTLYVYRSHSEQMRATLDQQLVTTSNALKLFADDYHDKLAGKGALQDAISEADYLTLLHRQAAFARAARVEYAYTLVHRRGKVLFTSDSPTDEDFATRKYAKLGEEYTGAPKGLLMALQDQRVHYDV